MVRFSLSAAVAALALGRSASQDFAGLSITKDNAAISMGVDGDVMIARGDNSSLVTDNTVVVKGMDIARAAKLSLVPNSMGWDLSQQGHNIFLKSQDGFELPVHFTIEFWAYVMDVTSSTQVLMSFASDDNQDCLRLRSEALTENQWNHVVVTYDRHATTAHVNGAATGRLLYNSFCGDHGGRLVFGQSQRAVDNDIFYAARKTSMYLDTVAIYDRVFDEAERGTTGKTCVDLADPGLITLYSGYTKATDLVGNNPGMLKSTGFVEGVNADGTLTCSNEGYGLGERGEDFYAGRVPAGSAAVGAVGWVFPGDDTSYHFFVNDLTLPKDFSIAYWVYPLDSGSGRMQISWASSSNNNCFFLSATQLTVGQWHHIVVTWDGERQTNYRDGKVTDDFYSSYTFCGDYTGGLSIGQEQDSVGGDYDENQAPAIILDTVAIYSRALQPDEIEAQTTPCIDVGDGDLYALYSGYSRGNDLVGSNDGDVTAIEIVTDGMSTTAGATYGWDDGDVGFNSSACTPAQDEVSTLAPNFDNEIVGGIGWDFPGDSIAYYFATKSNFTLPDEFTIEFWAYPRVKQGHLLSFATEDYNNCILLTNTQFDTYNAWHHVVVTVDSDDAIVAYIDGEEGPSSFVYDADFCGVRSGALVFGQEQDTLLGSFDPTQAFNGIIDTVAIYDVVWAADDIAADKEVGVDLSDPSLFALYSGYSRARDLVGPNNGDMYLYQFAEGMDGHSANVNTLEMLSPLGVGGVAWNLPAGQTDYYLATGDDFYFPDGDWTAEMWISIHAASSEKYFFSWATDSTDNCFIGQMSGFTSSDVDTWRHVVFTYDSANDESYAYKDGVETSGLDWGGFCGETGPGSLVIGQEQDSVGGGFSASQAADLAFDTLAIYGTYWDADTVADRYDNSACVSLRDATLQHLWSGFSRGKDLVGNSDVTVVTDEFLAGADHDCSSLFQ